MATGLCLPLVSCPCTSTPLSLPPNRPPPGTLDPMATGLLIVCVGRGTKAVDAFMAMTKRYSGTMRLGEATPSFDAETPVDVRAPWEHITGETSPWLGCTWCVCAGMSVCLRVLAAGMDAGLGWAGL